MRRREVITLLGGFGAALPALVARGQVLTKPALIGVLVAGSKEAPQPRVSGFPQGMQELGYVQGRNYMIEGRYGDSDLARLPALFQQLIARKADVIVAGTTAGILEGIGARVPRPVVAA